jgi:hypothetical protein
MTKMTLEPWTATKAAANTATSAVSAHTFYITLIVANGFLF